MSATFAGVRIFRMRRKNRIDVFYTDAIAIRHSIADTSTLDERTAAVQKIKALQAKAFEMLVDEQLAADESFRIFISLANDVLQEIGASNPAGS
jgi:serine phosphatase RsbU (regulator of sigma subunit)